MTALNLGCGLKPDPDMVNVDRVFLPGVNVACDLDEPWPWKDGEATLIRAAHVFEHVDKPVHFMCEAWRVLAPRGSLHIIVPWWQSSNSFTDPTHRRHCTERTFDYWIPGTELHRDYGPMYGGARFERLKTELRGEELDVILRKLP